MLLRLLCLVMVNAVYSCPAIVNFFLREYPGIVLATTFGSAKLYSERAKRRQMSRVLLCSLALV